MQNCVPGSGESNIHAAHICQEAHSSSSLTAAAIMCPHTAEQHHIRFFTLQPLQHQALNMMRALRDCTTTTRHDAQHAVYIALIKHQTLYSC